MSDNPTKPKRTGNKNMLEFNQKQARTLFEMFGGTDATITVIKHGEELLAYDAEYPEEGSVEL